MNINVIFKTSLNEYHVDDTPFAIPSTIESKQLCEIVKHLLNLEDDSIKFDFSVNGKLLQGTLEALLQELEIGTEATHEVYYFLKNEGTPLGRRCEHPDWVSDVEYLANRPDLFVTACYDGGLRVWSREKGMKLRAAVEASTMPLRAIATHFEGDDTRIYTVGKDRFARLWHYKKKSLIPKGTFEAEVSLNSVVCSPWGHAFGGWDGSILLGRVEEEGDVPDFFKRQKLTNGKHLLREGTTKTTELHRVECHRGPVVDMFWPSKQALYTASGDWSFSLWDPEVSTPVHVWDTQSPITSLSYSYAGNMLATSNTNRKIYMWDPRMKAKRKAVMVFRGHRNSVTDVSFVEQTTLLVSTSYDGWCKVWDIRGKSPLFTLGKSPMDDGVIRKGMALDVLGKDVLEAKGDVVEEFRLK